MTVITVLQRPTLIPRPHRPTRLDKTVLSRRVGVGGVDWTIALICSHSATTTRRDGLLRRVGRCELGMTLTLSLDPSRNRDKVDVPNGSFRFGQVVRCPGGGQMSGHEGTPDTLSPDLSAR